MKRMLAVFIMLMIPFGAHLSAQETCEVLVPELVGEYEGECRRGLANGFGKAVGTDTYEGNFRRGYPHGDGVYTWANGDVYEGRFRRGQMHGIGRLTTFRNDQEVVIEGVWRAGELIEEDTGTGNGYTVNSMRRLDGVRVNRTSDSGETVVFRVTRYHSPLRFEDMIFSGTSGQGRIHSDEVRFEGVEFPFRATLRYVVPNKMRSDFFQAELDITITEPGTWEVITQQ